MSDVADKLRAAKALIEDPKHWCRNTFARDERDCPTFALDDAAVSWCAVGALNRATCGEGYSLASDILIDAAEELHSRSVPYVNDHQGHAAVMAMYDRAIAKAEGAS